MAAKLHVRKTKERIGKLFHKSYSSKLQTPSFLPGCKFGKTQTLPDLEGQEQKPVVSAFTYNSAMSKKLTHGSFTSSVRRSPSHDKG